MARTRDQLSICPTPLLPDPFGVTPESFEAYVGAAVANDLHGLSYWLLHDVLLAQQGYSRDEAKAVIDASGLAVVCIEALSGWANADDASAVQQDAALGLELCDVFGAKTIVGVSMEPELESFDAAVTNLQVLADEAAKVDVTVCIEFLPWTGIPDIGTCWELIRRSERSNVAFNFDAWHWHRQPGGPTGANAELLASIPGTAIGLFQLCDAAVDPGPDPMQECMSNRPLPGEGVVDFDHLFALFREIAADPIVAPEVFNAQHAAEGIAPFATKVADTSRQVLARW